MAIQKKTIRSMWNTKFSCPKTSYDNLISNITYSSISIGRASHTIKRTVKNVGLPNATYNITIEAEIRMSVMGMWDPPQHHQRNCAGPVSPCRSSVGPRPSWAVGSWRVSLLAVCNKILPV
ncbi:CO(2)-response secreted protease [Tripterygium wilfordii]|uniref:CO(2)-response secreted protease n=1 Tax=Tripterygium wilfordii TaxID=458696 RepID=A0A7J7E1W1_TRIWF|nr:CO(2)-response secreted protease [Tripterygium wilfordii]